MLIEQVTVYGGFELLYLSLKSVAKIFATLLGYSAALPPELGELYKLLFIPLCAYLGVKIYNIIKSFFNYLNDKL